MQLPNLFLELLALPLGTILASLNLIVLLS